VSNFGLQLTPVRCPGCHDLPTRLRRVRATASWRLVEYRSPSQASDE
jgi:hypothetical protein